MAFYMEEEEVWKCPKHPSKRRRNGICPVCLKDRLVTLCPDCANRSRSVGIPFLRSRGGGGGYALSGSVRWNPPETARSSKTPSFWSILRSSSSTTKNKSRKESEEKENQNHEFKSNYYPGNGYGDVRIEEFTRMMMRSRSVSVAMTSGPGDAKKAGKGWHFPSPMKVFRQSKAAKVVQERSPLYRG
nr:Nuclear pore complex protein like [Ipomoea batatas]